MRKSVFKVCTLSLSLSHTSLPLSLTHTHTHTHAHTRIVKNCYTIQSLFLSNFDVRANTSQAPFKMISKLKDTISPFYIRFRCCNNLRHKYLFLLSHSVKSFERSYADPFSKYNIGCLFFLVLCLHVYTQKKSLSPILIAPKIFSAFFTFKLWQTKH